MKYSLVLLLILLSGCFVQTKDFNKAIVQINDFNKDVATKTGKLSEATDFISGKMLDKAKAEGDLNEVVLWAKNQAEIEALTEEFEELAKRKVDKASNGLGSFMRMLDGLVNGILNNPIITTMLSSMGLGGVVTAIKMVKMSSHNTRLKRKGKEHASSTEVNELDEDFD